MFKWELINDHTGEKQTLLTDPHGWEEIALEHNRSEKYDGMFLDFSRDLSFHCKGGGKEMLDLIFQEYGSEGKATLNIYFSCQGGFQKLAETFIHFPSYREEFKGKTLHTTVEVRKKGITQVVLSRDETDVDLLSETSIGGVALNPYQYAPYNLTLHSRIIFIESQFTTQEHTSCTRYVTSGLKENYFIPNTSVIKGDIDKSSDTTASGVFDNVFNGFLENAPAIINTDGNSILIEENTFTVDWHFTGHIIINTFDVSVPQVGCSAPTCGTNTQNQKNMDSIEVRLRLFYGSSEATEVSESCATPSGSDGQLQYVDLVSLSTFALGVIPYDRFYDLAGSEQIVLQPGDKVWLYWVIDGNLLSGSGDFTWNFTYSKSDLHLYSNTQASSTTAKAVGIHEAWSRICEGITDQTLAFKSEFFGRKNSQGLNYTQNGYAGFTAILDGLRIRGYEKSDNAILSDFQTKKGIITNLEKHYDSCNAVWGIGMGIETHDGVEVVRAEEKDYFYSDTEIYKISNIPNLEMSFAEELAFSEVQIGYEKWKIENKGGLDEPNTIARWLFPKIKNIKNVKELTSPYVAAMYAIEETRRKKFVVTEDSDYDDDIFFIALQRSRPDQTPNTLHVAEKNENIAITPDTLLAPETAYNLRFNLFSNFDRVMNQFTTNLTKDAPQQINYSYLEGNGQMEFDYNEPTWPHPGDLNGLKSKNVQNTEIPNGRHRRQYPILLPEIYTFTFPIPFSDYIDLIANPYGYILFSESEQKYKKGYIKTLSYNIAKQMAEFTLIRKYD